MGKNKTFANGTSERGLISGIYKEQYKLNTKNENIQSASGLINFIPQEINTNGQKMLENVFNICSHQENVN